MTPQDRKQTLTLGMGSVTKVSLEANEGTHFVLVAEKLIGEPFFHPR
jgi:hypothetical protein